MDPDESLITYRDEDLGPRWNALPEDVRDSLERRFFCAVLSFLGDLVGAEFRADLPLPGERLSVRASVRAASGHAVEKRGELAGPLSPPVACALVQTNPEVLTVEREGHEAFMLHDGWTGAMTTLESEHADALRRLLMEEAALVQDE